MTATTEPYLGRNPEQVNISNSEITDFKHCRRNWYLKYYLGRAPKETSAVGPLPLGIRIHEAMEAHYSRDEDLMEAYLRLFEEDKARFEESGEAFFADKEKKFHSEGELGRIMIEGYIEWMNETSGLAEYEIVDVENALQYEMLDGRVNLVGKVDIELTDKSDGSIYIGDFKTAVSFGLYNDTAHMSEQLLLYTMLRRLTLDKHTDGGVYIILKKVKRTASAKPPFYEKMVVRFNDTHIASFWERMVGTLEGMISTRDQLDAGVSHLKVAYPTVTGECGWRCAFSSMCYMMDDGSDWQGWLDTYTDVHNPYERYGDQLDKTENV